MKGDLDEVIPGSNGIGHSPLCIGNGGHGPDCGGWSPRPTNRWTSSVSADPNPSGNRNAGAVRMSEV